MTTTREGSTRTIVAVAPGIVDFDISDGWSTHDRGRSPQPIPGFGAARAACAAVSFLHFRNAGLPTHFERQVDSHTLRVREFTIPDAAPLSGKADGEVIPLEWLFRYEVGEKFRERVRAGKVDADALGIPSGMDISDVTELPHVFVECSTKYEPQDRYLSDEEARELAGLDMRAWATARRYVIQGAAVLRTKFRNAGYRLLDGKFELGRTHAGGILFVDVVGSPDEVRLKKESNGQLYCKEPLREMLERRPWFKELKAAKAEYPLEKSKWPSYPRLSQGEVAFMSDLYRELAFDYAGARVSD